MSFVLEMLQEGIKPTAGEYFYEVKLAEKRNDTDVLNQLAVYYSLFEDKTSQANMLQGSYFDTTDLTIGNNA